MLEVNLETVFLIEFSAQWGKDIFSTVYAFATGVADQVVMVSLFSMVINESAAALTFKHAAQSLEKLQRPVYG